MTTIAYKDGVVAYDSRSSSNGAIISDNYEKKAVKNKVAFFLSGTVADHPKFIDAYLGADCEEDLDAYGFCVDGGRLYRVGHSEGKVYREICELDEHYAAGSGSDHALTAMDLCLSAKEAVKMAMKRDTGTGGRVRTFKL